MLQAKYTAFASVSLLLLQRCTIIPTHLRTAAHHQFLTSVQDASAASDSGGASLVAEVWAAFQQYHESQKWRLPCVPNVSGFEEFLAEVQPMTLPDVTIPSILPGAPRPACEP